MMPQDFPSSGFEQAAGLRHRPGLRRADGDGARPPGAGDPRLRQRWAGAEPGRYDLTPEVVPALAALTHRVEALTLELRATGHHDTRPRTRLRTPSPPARLSDANGGPQAPGRRVTSAGGSNAARRRHPDGGLDEYGSRTRSAGHHGPERCGLHRPWAAPPSGGSWRPAGGRLPPANDPSWTTHIRRPH